MEKDFAIIMTGGKQYKVSIGEKIRVEKLDVQDATVFAFESVLLRSVGGEVEIGTPMITKAKVEAKKEEEPKIPGATIARANGTFLGLEVANGNFKLSFYDKKRKPAAIDVTRATARWPNMHDDTGDNRTVLNPSGSALVGSKPVLPPYTFNVFITLLAGDGDQTEAVESYAVPFQG